MAAALELLGEKWSLLVIRELFYGIRRFDQIARNTGAPRDVLTARLRSLESSGIITRAQYSDKPPRFEYELTEAGLDLQHVMRSLRAWGDKWTVESPPVRFLHRDHELDGIWTCRTCGEEVARQDLSVVMLASGWGPDGPTG